MPPRWGGTAVEGSRRPRWGGAPLATEERQPAPAPQPAAAPARMGGPGSIPTAQRLAGQAVAQQIEQVPAPSWGEVIRRLPGRFRASIASTLAGMEAAEFAKLEAAHADLMRRDPTGELARRAGFDGTPEEAQAIREELDLRLGMSREARADMEPLPGETLLQRGVGGVATSGPPTIAALATGIATRNPVLAAATMYPATAGQSFGDLANFYLDNRENLTPEQRADAFGRALAHARVQGGLEVGTEIIPMGILLRPGGSAIKKFARVLAAEIRGETVATITQAIDDVVARSPEGMTVEELLAGVEEGGRQLPETWVTTLIMAGAQSGAVSALDRMSRQSGGQGPVEPEDGTTPAADVLQGAQARLDELERQEVMSPDEQREADWLRQNGGNAERVAAQYGIRLRAELTPDDVESPLPNDLILEGKQAINDALAEQGRQDGRTGRLVRPGDVPAAEPIGGTRVGPDGRIEPTGVGEDIALTPEPGRIEPSMPEAIYPERPPEREPEAGVRPAAESPTFGRPTTQETTDAEEVRADAGQVQVPGRERAGGEVEVRPDLQRPEVAGPEAGDARPPEGRAPAEGADVLTEAIAQRPDLETVEEVTMAGPLSTSTVRPLSEIAEDVTIEPAPEPTSATVTPIRPDVIDQTDTLADRTRADIAGETTERARLIAFRNYLDDITDMSSDLMRPRDAVALLTRVEEAIESNQTKGLDSEIADTIREWLKEGGVDAEVSTELRAFEQAFRQSILSEPEFRVEWGGRSATVGSIEEAQEKWAEFRDTSEGGASDLGSAKVYSADGTHLGTISYNGRFWPTAEGKSEQARLPAPETETTAAGEQDNIRDLQLAGVAWDSKEFTSEGKRQLLARAGMKPARSLVRWSSLRDDEQRAIAKALPAYREHLAATEGAPLPAGEPIPDNINDMIAAGINPKVAEGVKAIRAAGIETSMSGDLYGNDLIYIDLREAPPKDIALPRGWKLVPTDVDFTAHEVLGKALTETSLARLKDPELRQIFTERYRRRLARAGTNPITADEAAELVQALTRRANASEPDTTAALSDTLTERAREEAKIARNKAFEDSQRGITERTAAVNKLTGLEGDAFTTELEKRTLFWLKAERGRARKAGETARAEAIDSLITGNVLDETVFTQEWADSMRAEIARRKTQIDADKKQQAAATRGKKHGSTGESLRRWFDGQKKAVDDAKGSIAEVLTALEKATNRAQAFPVDELAEGGTPGLRRYLEAVRSELPTFKKMAVEERWGSDVSWADAMERFDSGDLEVAKDAAREYLEMIRFVAEQMRGHPNIKAAAHQLFKSIMDMGALTEIAGGRERAIEWQRNYRLGDALHHYGWQHKTDHDDQAPWRIRELLRTEEKSDEEVGGGRHTPVRRTKKPISELERRGLPDHRKGKDQSSADLKKTFGFADITVGQYVTSAQEQEHLNGSYDAFSDLAQVLGLKPKDMSMSGSLHYAIGALGHGRHSAHYAPMQPGPAGPVQVINVTNTSGDGTVAHEFGHAVDYNLRSSLARGMGPAVSHVVRRLTRDLGPQVIANIEASLRSFLDGSMYYQGMRNQGRQAMASYYLEQQLRKLRDGTIGATTEYFRQANAGGADYWAKPEELFARAFESWVYDTLNADNKLNEYLVTDHVSDGKVKPPASRFAPYPQGEERQSFNRMFTAFVKALKVVDGRLTIDASFEQAMAADEKAISDRILELQRNLKAFAEEYAQEKRDKELAAQRAKEAKEKAAAEQAIADLKSAVGPKSIDETLATASAAELDQAFDDALAQLEEEKADQHFQGSEAQAVAEKETGEPTPMPDDRGEEVDKNREVAQRIADIYAIKSIDQRFVSMDNADFFKAADEVYGGTRGDGVYETRQAYDAMELGVNMAILNAAPILRNASARQTVALLDRLTAALPTQAIRSDKQIEYQQFSTPPAYSFAAAYAANIRRDDMLLEPSAGTGSLAIYGMGAGAHTTVNEIEFDRSQLLEALKPDAIRAEDGVFIGDILKGEDRPTVVLMNPPFSSDAVGGAKNTTMRGAEHVESALKALRDNGRLVAIVGKGMARGAPSFREWWSRIEKTYNVLAVIEVDGTIYRKYGTSFDNVLIVIDKSGPTKAAPLVKRVENIADLVQSVENIRDGRPRADESTPRKPARPRDAGVGQDQAGPGAGVREPADAVGAGTGRPRDDAGGGVGAPGAAGAGGRAAAGRPDVADEPRGGLAVGEPGRVPGDRGTAGGGTGAAGGVVPGSGSVDRERSVGELAKSAAKHGVKFSEETLTGLAKLFGGPGTLRSFPGGIDPETYAAAKPHFERAYQEAVAAGKDLATMVKAIVEWAGRGIEPYLRYWLHERRSEVQSEVQSIEPEYDPATEGLTDTTKPAEPQQSSDLTDDVYETYQPVRAMAGSKPHPADLSETAAMGDVDPIEVDYTPNLPQSIIASGALSDAQSEVVVMAGAAHNRILPEQDGVAYRHGFIVGDGTGVGKAREMLGIILDNMRRGRTKALYVSKNQGLINDLRENWEALEQDADTIIPLADTSPGGPVKADRGILYTTYNTLGLSRGAAQKGGASEFVAGRQVRHTQTGKTGVVARTSVKGNVSVKWDGTAKPESVARPVLEAIGPKPQSGDSRQKQIIDWLGKDFDGVVVFDEAHMMSNGIEMKGSRGVSKAADMALAGIELAKQLPNARVVYATATAAQEVRNLAYMNRLGLWGPGTPFADVHAFISQIEGGGVAAMELVAKDMKALGVYIARQISYKGLSRETITHTLTQEQREIYNELARAWGVVLNNINKFLEQTKADKNPRAKARIKSLIWSFQQRFFNQIITTMKMPSVVEDAKKRLEAGDAVVFQLVNTGDAATERAIERMEAAGKDMDDLDVSSKDDLIDMVRKTFPTQKYRLEVDENGNEQYVPVFDAEGNPVEDQEAVAARDQLIQNLNDIRIPEWPLDILINSFGTRSIAEVTGRSRRVVTDPRTGEREIQPTPNTEAEIAEFQDGKKLALVFSDAGGTGKGYHADLTRKNQRRRIHYLIQGGWSATKAVQGFGRTHRSNQKQPPNLVLVTSDIQAEKRFTSSIARRLDQLGALTRGQRKTGGQGMFSAEDNLENEYATSALHDFMRDIAKNEVEGITKEDVERELGIEGLTDDAGHINESKLPEVKTFLNRLLSVPLERMDEYFNGFFTRLEASIEAAKASGDYDAGVENLIAEKVTIAHRETVFTDKRSGAETEYVEFELTDPVEYRPIEAVAEMSEAGRQFLYFAKNKRSEKVYAIFKAPNMTKAGGNVVPRVRIVGISTNRVEDANEVRIEGEHWNANYDKVEAAEARTLWEAETKAAPSHRTWHEHMIVGAVLPVWDRLLGKPKIFRTVADGERFIGRVIPQIELKQTLKNLGAGGKAIAKDPKSVIAKVKQGWLYTLSNGWRLTTRKVGGETRVRVLGPGFGESGRQAESFGMLKEIIEHATMYFATEQSLKTMFDRGVDIVDEVPPAGSESMDLGSSELTAEAVAKLPAIMESLKQRLEKVGIADRVALSITEKIVSSTGREYKGARGRYFNRMIEIALGNKTKMATLNHEIIHALRDLGVIRPAEWRVMVRTAEADTEQAQAVRDRYTEVKPDLNEDKLTEEVVAHYYPRWVLGEYEAKGFIRTAFQRIKDFFEALGNALRGNGFQSANDVFRRIGSGEMGLRPPYQRGGFKGQAQFEVDQKQTETAAFKRWFGDSKVVNENGEPLVVYHGAPGYVPDFSAFDRMASHTMLGKRAVGMDTVGSWFSEAGDKQGAGLFAGNSPESAGRVIPVYLSIKNPWKPKDFYEFLDKMHTTAGRDPKKQNPRGRGSTEEIRAWLKANGYDGMYFPPGATEGNSGTWVTLEPTQIKSAIGNRGTFDPENPDIAFELGEDTRLGRGKHKFRPPVGITGKVEFSNKESERRWQEARKGVAGQESWLSEIKQQAGRIGAGFTRHFINLPNAPEFSRAREKLRQIEAAPQAAKEEVLRTLKEMTKGMSRADLDLFTRKAVLDDLSFEVENEHQLPFGFTPEDVKTELAKVNKALENRHDLMGRIEARRKLAKRIANELVAAGVLHKEQIKNPAYYRHQVLDYARAQVAYAQGSGNKLKAPHWARRMGSRLDINANLLEAEFEWMQKALTDIAIAKTIDWFKKSDYNVRDQVVANAKAHNERLVRQMLEADIQRRGWIDKQGRDTSPLTQEWRAFRQRIAYAFSLIRKAIEDGSLTDIPSGFDATVDDLLSGTAGEGSVFPFLAWILDNNKPGSMGAAMAFKAINQRKAWIRQHLGEKYADPLDIEGLVKRGFAPEGYGTWQPDEGNLLFTAKTLPEHVIDRLMDRVAEQDAGPVSAQELRGALESVRSMLAVGGPKYQMVLPDELVATLSHLRDEHARGLVDYLAATPLSWWKRWVLINPRRVLKYNLNNLSGDLDAIIAGNPKALRKLPQAIRELKDVMLKGKTPSDRYREAVERGVFDSGLTVQEIPDINYLSEFERLLGPPTVGKVITAPFAKFWNASQRYTWFRENWLRYAAYLDYAERLEAGESMKSIGYGAAHIKMVDALDDTKDKAALLARELVGDYGAVSAFGQGIRRTLIPFYSWLEINTKRYWRLMGNAWQQGIGKGFRTSGIVGATLGIRTSAYLTFRMALLYGLVQIWNNLVMGDEEDDLGAEERARLHLIIGRDANGEVITLRFQGALSDFLDWFGFDDAVGMMSEIERGRASAADLLKAMAKAPVNKVVSGLTPLITAPVEMFSGQSYWPDVFRPRSIRDKWRHLAQLFSMEHEYDRIFDRPSRGYPRSLTETVVYRRDPGENAYNRIKGMAYDWERRETGQAGGGGYQTPRSQALYDWRQAQKFGDFQAEMDAMRRLRELGVTDADLRSSIRNAHPLGSLSIRDRGAFMNTLSARERTMLQEAIQWYESTFLE